jgi:uncharacterized membrane protein
LTLETSKNLGGAGALLIFLGPILSALPAGIGGWAGILSLVGAILVLVALKGFADLYKEQGIFKNTLYAIIVAIVGVVLFVVLVISVTVDFFNALGLNITNLQDWSSLSSINWQSLNMDLVFRFAGTLLLNAVVAFVFLIITAVFLKKSLVLMANKTGVGMFGTTGLMLLIGAILTIIFIGPILVWIAMLLLAVAFFSVKT